MSLNFSDHLPLPSSSSNEDLETISRNKFSSLLDPALFEVRPEYQRDKGIDLIVEIKKENRYTNFRFAIQLKATDSLRPNADGSLSFPVEVSNINYLLNYGMPAYYVLYDHRSDIFYHEGVNDVFQKLLDKYRAKKLPDTFNVRFSKPITPDVLQILYSDTLESGNLLRNLNLRLKFPVSNEEKQSSAIIIDERKDVHSVAENIEYISRFGPMLVNDAQFDHIIDIEQRTHPRPKDAGLFNLICGVAYFQRGNLFKAMELLKLARQHSEGFEPHSNVMLNYTLLNTRFLIGILDKGEFDRQCKAINESQTGGSFFEIERAYDQISKNEVRQSENIQIFYKAILAILDKEPVQAAIRITAYAKVLTAEAVLLFFDLGLNAVYFLGRTDRPFETKAFQEWFEFDRQYLQRLNSLFTFAAEHDQFLAVSNLSMDKVRWQYQKLFRMHLFEHWERKAFKMDQPIKSDYIDKLAKGCELIDNVLVTYEMLAHWENLLSGLFCKYEILHFLGDAAGIDATKDKILEIIDEKDYNGLLPKFKQLINGGTSHEKFIRDFTKHMNRIQDFATANGIDVYSKLPENFIAELEPKWAINSFFEFEFPKSLSTSANRDSR